MLNIFGYINKVNASKTSFVGGNKVTDFMKGCRQYVFINIHK